MKAGIVLAAMLVAGTAHAAQGTWTGEITAEACAGKHVAEFHGSATEAKSCAEDCLKGGGKYVFVTGGKVYQIANQKAPALKAHVGEQVKVTGDLAGNALTVSNVSAATARK